MEHSFNCPYCGEEISMVLDLSVRRQTYVEDCEVCCQPIEISYSVEDEELAGFDADAGVDSLHTILRLAESV
ncbi:MAG: CPXCG motif-containing cysteine-rich protein [Candidatus Acidiferrum sp.]